MDDAVVGNGKGRRFSDGLACIDALRVCGEGLDVRLLVVAVGAVRGEVCFVDNDVGQIVCIGRQRPRKRRGRDEVERWRAHGQRWPRRFRSQWDAGGWQLYVL